MHLQLKHLLLSRFCYHYDARTFKMNLRAKFSAIVPVIFITTIVLIKSPICQGQAVKAERESLPFDHDHDGTNPEGGGARINRHVVNESEKVSL